MGAPLIHTLRVRYGESDLQGIAFNAHYLNYFDIGMTELWRAAFGNYQTMLERGVDMVLAEARLRFRRPARFDDELDLSVAVTHMGTTSIITRHFARCRGGRCGRGRPAPRAGGPSDAGQDADPRLGPRRPRAVVRAGGGVRVAGGRSAGERRVLVERPCEAEARTRHGRLDARLARFRE